MESPKSPIESMESYYRSCEKYAKANKAGDRTFPVLIGSMIALPAIMTWMGRGPVWALLIVPAIILVVALYLYARKKHWAKKEQTYHNKVKADIVEAFHLNISGTEDGDSSAAIYRQGG